MRVAGDDGVAHVLSNEAGEETSHLQGIFWRTIAMAKAGIKPLWVFDGVPPALKSGEIASRNARRERGARAHEAAAERGDVAEMNRQSKRTTRVTRKHAEDAKELLRLMGVPTLDAPCEAEAQCAELARKGVVHATATEDMDALCCGSPLVVRHLTFSEARKVPVLEYSLPRVLAGLNLSMPEFVDLCILCGTDFSDTIRGVGPKGALAAIRKHRSIEAYLAALNTTRHPPPVEFPVDEIRGLLSRPDVVPASDARIVWGGAPDVEGVVALLVDSKGFSEARVRGGLEGLPAPAPPPRAPRPSAARALTRALCWGAAFAKARKQTPQRRLNAFFTKPAAKPAEPSKPAEAAKPASADSAGGGGVCGRGRGAGQGQAPAGRGRRRRRGVSARRAGGRAAGRKENGSSASTRMHYARAAPRAPLAAARRRQSARRPTRVRSRSRFARRCSTCPAPRASPARITQLRRGGRGERGAAARGRAGTLASGQRARKAATGGANARSTLAGECPGAPLSVTMHSARGARSVRHALSTATGHVSGWYTMSQT